MPKIITEEIHVVIFAGPNGSGKTSLIDEVKSTGLQVLDKHYPVPENFINPDQVSKDLKGEYADQKARDWAAFHTAVRMRDDAINNKLPFAFETVMSHPSRINEMLKLREQGYVVLFAFVATSDPEINVARVKFRFDTGSTTGHYVPPDTVRERYHRTLALLPKAVEIADAIFVYDNSKDFTKASLQASMVGETFKVVANPKDWIQRTLIEPMRKRGREFDVLSRLIARKGFIASTADELRGNYTGNVIFQTSSYLCQMDQTTGQVVIHDRLMLDLMQPVEQSAAPFYSRGQILTVSYSQTEAPSVERHADISLARIETKTATPAEFVRPPSLGLGVLAGKAPEIAGPRADTLASEYPTTNPRAPGYRPK